MSMIMSPVSKSPQLAFAHRAARSWLLDAVFPLWGGSGIDRVNGGFFEKIDQAGAIVPNVPRRVRVVPRQIYSFAVAGRWGWQGPWAACVDHGAEALFEHCIAADGLCISTYAEDGTPINAAYDFYDNAFALFALAELATHPKWRARAVSAADTMMNEIEARFSHPVAGFSEDDQGGVPLRANPHMHMLEACLAQAKLPGASPRWQRIADHIVELAMTRFIDSETVVLREFFDYQWQPMPDASGRLIEPGHQFEWSWLLHQWNSSGGRRDVAQAADRLCAIGEMHGVNAYGLAVDELWDDFMPRTPTARTWPQTERVKACVEQAAQATDTDARERWESKAADALTAMMRFAATETSGLWFDRFDADGQPIPGPAPASTLYHIVCAMETCGAYLEATTR